MDFSYKPGTLVLGDGVGCCNISVPTNKQPTTNNIIPAIYTALQYAWHTLEHVPLISQDDSV